VSGEPHDGLAEVIALYNWRGATGDFNWVREEWLREVRAYVEEFAGQPEDWDVIIGGGVRGYSMFLHEWVEIQSYRKNNWDPFDQDQQRDHYDPMHSLALFSEHHFLQAVAAAMGYLFTMGELVTYNPHGDPPGGALDWDLMERELADWLGSADRDLRLDQVSTVQGFYARLGFQGWAGNDG
jgi:hypothetical protein